MEINKNDKNRNNDVFRIIINDDYGKIINR